MANFNQYVDVENIKDSLELASGTDIAEYEDGNVTVKLVVNGEVSLDYKGEIYNNVNDFPEKLKTIIHEGNAFNHDDVDVLNNNWLELEVFVDGEYIGDFFGDTGAVFEAEGLSSSIIEETMQNYAEKAKDYMKEQEQNIKHQFSFNWKYRDFEIRTNANYNRELYVELIKWKEDGTCFTLAIYCWDKEGGEWCFIGDRPFEYIAEIDVTPIWKQMWMAAEMFTDWYEKERFDF